MSTAETETKRSLPSREDMPDEIWGLWDTELGEWVLSIEECQKLMFFSEDEADEGVKCQGDTFGLPCVPWLLWRKGVR